MPGRSSKRVSRCLVASRKCPAATSRSFRTVFACLDCLAD
uniref:Uncharacterized protein n=1 Tax=Arundo donax TaxID=35708 RepID=A0A0A8YBH6_ARUDO